MEVWGIGVDMEGCLHARNVLGKKLRHLEKEAYKLAGITFSLSTAADIANVLYVHLKLPIPDGQNKGKQHPSTDKHCLDLLRYCHLSYLLSLLTKVNLLADCIAHIFSKPFYVGFGSISGMSILLFQSLKSIGHWQSS